ncbi:YbbR-like domain-containing protein [Thermodesulfobacteriota bacterium]
MEKLVRQIIATASSYRRPKNWVLKLVSLFFALFLWYFVVGEDKVDMNVTLPVEIVNLPRDLIISNQFKKQIEVTISGQRSLIRGMTEQHISRSIDLSKAKPGTVVIQNNVDSISLPRGLSILRVQPPTLTLLLDRLIRKELPIRPVLVGKVDKDFTLDSVTVDPETLEISGPQAILDNEQELKTIPIDINGLNESTVKQASLALKHEISDLIGEPVVAVRLSLSSLKKEMTFTDIPIDFEHEKGQQSEMIYRLLPPTVSINAEIPQEMVRKPNGLKSLFQARINPETLQPGSANLKVFVEGPPQAKIIAIKPESVTLRISQSRKLKIKP